MLTSLFSLFYVTGEFHRFLHRGRAEKLLFNDLLMIYKCMNNLTPDYLRERLKQRSEIHQRDTRQKSELALPKCRLATGQRAFAFRGAKIFNSLPKFIRDTETLGSFKRRIFNIFNS